MHWGGFSGHHLRELLDAHGVWAVFAIVALECVGLPIPGEGALLTAAIYAGETHHLDLPAVLGAAIAGAVAGSVAGFAVGRSVGFRLLLRFGPYVGLTDRRLKLGLYLFRKYGGGIVFFGRFVAFARTWAALLAGMNRMPWRRFLTFNTSGAVVWALGVGFIGYGLGTSAHRWTGILRAVLLGAAAIALIAGAVFLNRNAKRLTDEAELALPGPVDRYGPGHGPRGVSRRSPPRRVG
jgi:membrane protein DedA with SNARE-associated domain